MRALIRRSPVVKKILYRVMYRGVRDYEQEFHDLMVATIRPNDCVWDVGANIGLYTSQFADWVGQGGHVVAFEPARGCQSQLQALKATLLNVTVAQLALSDATGTAYFDDSRGDTDVQNQLSESGRIEVRVVRADDLFAAEEFPQPDAVKIDVEGFEPEVIDGFGKILGSANRPRALFVEVHFGALEKRGKRDFPKSLERTLRSCGYEVTWVDISHLVAVVR